MNRVLKYSLIHDVEIGEGTIVHDHVDLYKCKIGKNCKIDSFVYIEEGVVIGDRCKVRPFVFIPTGVTIGNGVFIGPNVTFTNDKYPKVRGDWVLLKTKIESNASIGGGCTILPGITVGRARWLELARCNQGCPRGAILAGNPAKVIGCRKEKE